jgi:predicted metal-dependent hydrolase
MEILNFNGITCQVVRKNSRRVRIAFHGGRLRMVLPRHLDPLPIIDRHKKWILAKHEWFRQQRLLAGQLPLSSRSNGKFIDLVRKASERCSQVLDVRPEHVTFRKMKSKWGSCGTGGRISLNSRLHFLPEALIAYVVFHELAHLKVHNHGPQFKALIRSAFPDFRDLDKKLKLYALKIL